MQSSISRVAAPALRPAITSFVAFAFLWSLGGCGTPSPLACPETRAGGRVATVFYATDRRAETENAQTVFTGERAEPPGLHLGRKSVALGPKHHLGKVDPAVAILSDGAPETHPGGSRLNALRRSDAEIAAFASERLRRAIRASRPASTSGRRQVLLYVHGFNNQFDEAVRKTAQLAGDLGLVDCDGTARGVAIAYSWPTLGGVFSYVADEENAEWTEQRLTPFLEALSKVCRSENAELSVVAHSMGARAVIRSLADLSRFPNDAAGRLADHVVLLAPDIGKGIFDQYVERILPHIRHMTIYVSARDRALAFSSFLHGGKQRLGMFGSAVVATLEFTGLRVDDHRYLMPTAAPTGTEGKIDMIDVSGGFALQLGHTYADAKFIRDLRALIQGNIAPGVGERANLVPRDVSPGLFRGVVGKRLRYYRLKTD